MTEAMRRAISFRLNSTRVALDDLDRALKIDASDDLIVALWREVRLQATYAERETKSASSPS